MAESSDTGQSTESKGIGMRLTISGIQAKFPSVKNLTTQAFSTLIHSHKTKGQSRESSDHEENILIIDARPEEEYNISHIPEARRVDYQADSEVIIDAIPEIQVPATKTTVVCYCSVGYRSSMVAEKIGSYMKNKGLLNKDNIDVYNLEGSLFQWANENRPLVDMNNKMTKFAHPYNAVFGKLLKKELRKTTLESLKEKL